MPKSNPKQPGRIRRAFAGFRLILKLMGEFDQYRIEMALSKVKRSKFAVYLVNLFVFSALAYVKFSAAIKEKWRDLFTKRDKQDWSQIWDEKSPPRYKRSQPRVMIVGEMLNKQCRLYRVDQKVEQLERLGWHCEVFSWQQLAEAEARLFNVDIVIFYRVLGTPKVLALIDRVRSLNRIAIFDVDDLVFDKALLQEKYDSESELLPDDVKQGNLYAADLYKLAAQHCDYALTTTSTLQTLLRKLVIQNKCFVLPNALSEDAYRIAALPKPNDAAEKITILYGSGSQTHDDDFQKVVNALIRLMQVHANVQIAVLGKLNLPAEFEKYRERIIQLPILDFTSYLMFVRQSDINIAPLQSDIFNDAKSEIKWLEAALFEVPTVMTPTKTYRNIIEPGETGFFAETEEQWYSHLHSLVESQELRMKVGANAKRYALDFYGRDVMSRNLSNAMHEIQEHALSVGILQKQLSEKKISILVVDSFYSPIHAQDDPFNSARRQVESLISKHTEDYEVLVVTADSQETDKYVVNKHALNGIRVRALGLGLEIERINDYQNPRIKKIFKEIIDSFAPDIIHFHHLDNFSGSVIEVAKENDIPYVVTVYDTYWWLTSGKYRGEKTQDLDDRLLELDPYSMVSHQVDINDKIQRSIYLTELLNSAERVFCLSNFQYEMLSNNGIESALLPEGIGVFEEVSMDPSKVENTSEVSKIALLSYDLDAQVEVLQALSKAADSEDLSALDINSIDFSQLSNYQGKKTVEGIEINVRGCWQDFEDISRFVREMDIVILGSAWRGQSGLLIAEATAAGAWVVMPDTSAFADAIRAHDAARLYPVNEKDKLIAIFKDLISEGQRESEKDVFSLEDNVDQLINHYRDIHSSIHSDTL